MYIRLWGQTEAIRQDFINVCALEKDKKKIKRWTTA